MSVLNPAQRRALKALAYALDPAVRIGGQGLSNQVLGEIERALAAHELVKIRAAAMNGHEREKALATICARTGAQRVQHIGKILVVYRKKPEQEKPGPVPTRSARRGSRSA